MFGYLRLPKQQRVTENANFNPFINDLTNKSKELLFNLGMSKPTIRPTGRWVHRYMTSCITSSFDIMATRNGVRYIPGHKILAIKNVSLAIQIGRSKLIPDQLFALDYGGSYCAFALEVDRGTEPKTTKAFRKSYSGSIELYRCMIEGQLYKQHYDLNANLLVLWVFSSRSNQARFLEMVGEVGGNAVKSIFTQTVDWFHESWLPPSLYSDLYTAEWMGSRRCLLRLSFV